VVTLVDAVNGLEQLETMEEPVKQAALADRIVITKSDIAGDAVTAKLETRLRELNPQVPIRRALNGEIELAFLIDVGLRNVKAKLEDIERWMGAPDEHGHRHSHDSKVKSFTLRYAEPMTWAAFSQTMEVLGALRGSDMLRVKGLINVVDHKGPMVIQGVQHLFHPPVELDAWPSADQSTRIVFITRNIPRETVANLFAAIGAVTATA
jgi:G3E family GTPase